MSTRSLIHAITGALLILGLSPSLSSAQERKTGTKPNVLFLFADDYCYEAVRAFGMTDIDTPNLDRLVKNGTTFTRAYNMGSWSGAVCVPSRAMLITGRHLWDVQKVHKTMKKECEAGRLWPQLLQQSGYNTYFTGKWHIRADASKAFQVASHVRPGMPRTVPSSYNRPLKGKTDPWSPYDKKLGGFWEGGRHWSAIVADDATGFIKREAKDDKPFFAYVAFNAPHDPRQAPKEYVEKYPTTRIKVPENFLPEYPYKEEMAAGKKLRDERLAPFPRTPDSVKVHRGEYYALITHMDAQIGRILKALEESGQADNTWIFFTADHGLAVGHHGLFGKQNLYDHSVRVPFMVVGPKVPKGKTIDAPIYLQDVMPTALELAGAKKPEHVWFHSLLPLIKGRKKTSPYDAIYGAYLDAQRSITANGYKLILYPKAKKARLYHLAKDPKEMKDLADNASSLPMMKKLFSRLIKLQKEVEDKRDLKAVFPHLQS